MWFWLKKFEDVRWKTSIINFIIALTCFSNMGSSAGSNSSATFSSKQGFPKRTAFSRLRRKSLSVSLITSKPFSFSCKEISANEKSLNLLILQLCLFSNRFSSFSSHILWNVRDRKTLFALWRKIFHPYLTSTLIRAKMCMNDLIQLVRIFFNLYVDP